MVGGPGGENYKVISLRWARQLTGRDVTSRHTDGGMKMKVMKMMMMVAGSQSKDGSRRV